MAEPTLDEQIEELERELAIREKVYPRWINHSVKGRPAPKLTPWAAERQLGRLKAAIATLKSLKP